MSQILHEVHQVVHGPAPFIRRFDKCLEQNDGNSCGSFLIENIYCDLVQENWNIKNPNLLTQVIRERHLRLLQNYDCDFYNGFYERQAKNQPIVFEIMALH